MHYLNCFFFFFLKKIQSIQAKMKKSKVMHFAVNNKLYRYFIIYKNITLPHNLNSHTPYSPHGH